MSWRKKSEVDYCKGSIHIIVSEKKIDTNVSMDKTSGDNEDQFRNRVDAPSDSVVLDRDPDSSALVIISFECCPVALKKSN